MIQWFKKLKIKHIEERQQREKEWKIIITDVTCLLHPQRYRPIQLWYKWAEMQARVLAQIQKILPSNHIYVRLNTYFPEYYKNIVESCNAVTTTINKKRGTIFLFPDCEDHNILKELLRGAGLVPLARCIFMLENKPPNWREIITKLFEIAEKLEEGHSIEEYSNNLSACSCLCYSLDEDLIIAKIDLTENLVMSILENVAREEGLELVVERRP